MICLLSRSNPKVLFTFQFGSRIVPLLSEQDLRKSLVSIALLGQAITFNLFPLLLPAFLALSLAVLAADGMLGSLGLKKKSFG